jgi:PPOX class probable F420-dependent enzyme
MATTPLEQPEYGPGQGPGPKKLTDDDLSGMLGEHRFGALAANRVSGHPHLSTVAYRWDPEERVVRVPTVDGRLKVRLLRADRRSALYVTSDDNLSFVVAEGVVELSDVSTTPGDAAGRELLGLFEPFDEPFDETAFFENMVTDRRLVVRLRVDRLYGTVLDV